MVFFALPIACQVGYQQETNLFCRIPERLSTWRADSKRAGVDLRLKTERLFKSSQNNLDLQSLSPALHSKASNRTKNQGFILWEKLRGGFSGFKGIRHSGAVGWSVKQTTRGLAVIRILKRLLLQQQHPGTEPQTFSLPGPPSYPTLLLTLLGDWTIFWKN